MAVPGGQSIKRIIIPAILSIIHIKSIINRARTILLSQFINIPNSKNKGSTSSLPNLFLSPATVIDMAGEGLKLDQRHGKDRIRVCRVWRKAAAAGGDVIVDWTIGISILSDCLPAYTSGDNSAIVATDSMKNTVYAKAKECTEVTSAEEFAIILANHFTSSYPQVTTALIKVVQKNWERVVVDSQQHSHGFRGGSDRRTVEVTLGKNGALNLASGIEGLVLLKTTKSGFEGFIRDKYTLLPDTRERMMATTITASWRYSFHHLSDIPRKQFCFTDKYQAVKKILADNFFGPPDVGVYSPSVQNTLYIMGKAVLNRFPEVESIQLRMPNLHFLPVNLSGKDNPHLVKFADDVYLPTDEPHGTIEATLQRAKSKL